MKKSVEDVQKGFQSQLSLHSSIGFWSHLSFSQKSWRISNLWDNVNIFWGIFLQFMEIHMEIWDIFTTNLNSEGEEK